MRPPTIAVTMPCSGRTPDAIAKAMASGSATRATVMPAPTSVTRSSRRYCWRLAPSLGRKGKRREAWGGNLKRFYPGIQVIARAALGADEVRLVRALLDLAAQPQDLHVDRP